MQRTTRWARRCGAAVLAIAATGAWAAPPAPPAPLDPSGVYAGEVKCEGISSEGAVNTVRSVTVGLPHMDGSSVRGMDDLGGLGGHYRVGWFPIVDGKKGTLSFYAFNDVDFLYSETGVAKINGKKGEPRTFNGDSIVFVNQGDAGRTGLTCEWKLDYVEPYNPS